ncbi:MAG: cardiolipin synthase [Phycisphaeraceae bacterium]
MPSLPDISWIAVTIFIVDWIIRIGLSLRVVMRRRPVGVSLSWLGVIFLVPFLGAIVYLILGENRIGRLRQDRFESIRPTLNKHLRRLHDHVEHRVGDRPAPQRALIQHSLNRYGFPLLCGNSVELLPDSDTVFDRLIDDIEAAKETLHLQFYIWWPGGKVDRVIDAIQRARERGVVCRCLADAVGSKTFLKSPQRKALVAAGVEMIEVLPVGIWRMMFRRQDLRNHRKIVVIDGQVGYTGSMNMADPALFKKEMGVGRWRDAMVRVTGPVVETLGLVFLSDFDTETDAVLGDFEERGGLKCVDPTGEVDTQLMPSGPGFAREAIRETLLTAMYGAEKTLVMTTPYFIPDEPLLDGLITAAKRGVEVTLIVPEQIDSVMARLASRSQYVDLLNAGVKVMQFADGLLHTKTLVADEQTALIGTVNLDMRSLWLNFEVTLAVYDEGFAKCLSDLQWRYAEQSVGLDQKQWINRPFHTRLIENAARLLGPLL